MKTELKIILVLLFTAVLFYIVRSIRNNKFELRLSFPWLLLDICLLILSLFPSILSWLASFLSIYDEMNMLFFLGFCFILIVIYFQAMAISKQAGQIRRLAQEIAIMEKRDKEE